ncbi:hypothetical protein KPC83_01005 [Collinsella sp. zg1085]|uniref:hypothetical protein n=1 Tax=Collinsella sp. zg1085 TaxID=2844380 RepID=UPI001C0D227A|nr:hypothetical protein [Collinsella sp. zg1085]QWT17771.1 hypothetical protein KPC83_01005 [Collinsella sp. zg1085]
MKALFEPAAILHESRVQEDHVKIWCHTTAEGAFELHQLNEGPLAHWCFDTSPYEYVIGVDAQPAAYAAERLGLEGAHALPRMFAALCMEADACLVVCDLFDELTVPVYEKEL